MAAIELAKAESEKPRPFGTGYRLIGHDYSTNELVAKVTGQSKYAEDFRAQGMLICRVALSPMPHARVKRINAEKALKMPGVRGILTPSEIPGYADSNRASRGEELALADEPMYQGEPIFAVAAVDELTAANAIEAVEVEMEPLPFNTDPLDSLRPGSANARLGGNVWVAKPRPHPPELTVLKWTEEDFAAEKEGKLPMGHAPDEWSFGDLDAGFKNPALVLDETFSTEDVSHQCLEQRSTMAFWQNGKLFLYTGTQSTMQCVPAIARLMHMPEEKIVFISEYTGGGFGSKNPAPPTLVIPALLSKKLNNVPVLMRISRRDEHFIGRARPAIRARTKIGFAKDGRITALDMFLVSDAGSYGSNGDAGACGQVTSLLYQPPAMRWRNVTVATNTIPRTSQRAPGGVQAVTIMEPILAKAARKLGVDHVALHRVNCPEGKAEFGPPDPRTGKRAYTTSCFLKQALDEGAKQFNWSRRVARPKRSGAKVRGVGVAMSTYQAGSIGYDGLIVITPKGRVQIHTGIGNLGTESVIDAHRAAAEVLNVPWSAVDIVWGDTSKDLPYTCQSNGSQTIHAMTRAGHAVGLECVQRLKEVAAKTHGGQPENYEVANLRVSRKGGGASMSFAQAAQAAIKLGGVYDGHEVNPEVNPWTKRSVAALAGSGLVVSAKDTYKRDGRSFSFVASFAEVETDVETGEYRIIDFLGYADVGTVVHPAALGGQIVGGSTLGIGHAIGQKWVIDPQWGVTVADRFYSNHPPTIMDVPADMKWNALNIPDPETPVGARGVGEPPVGAGCASILNALSDALGDSIFQRVPVYCDTILTSYEAGRPMQNAFVAHI